MSQRERHASGTLSEPAPRPASGQPGPVRSLPPPDASSPTPPAWEEAYRSATPAQRRDLLALAQRQGVVYAHQLPATSNGTAPDQGRRLLLQLATGNSEGLEPFVAAACSWVDPDLDAAQREAVARGLATPDLFLLQGQPGTGKSRVLAELVTQAARQGERVLLLAATPAAADRVLEQVAGRTEVLAVRCVGKDERADQLPPSVRGLTFAEQVRTLADTALQAAERQAQAAETRSRRRQQDDSVLAQLAQLAERTVALEQAVGQVEQELAAVPAAVASAIAEQEATPAAPLVPGLAEALTARTAALAQAQTTLAALQQRLAETQQQRTDLEKELSELAPFIAARQEHKWWTKTWWQASRRGDVLVQAAELETRKQTLEATLTATSDELRAAESAQGEIQAHYQAARTACVETEVARRQEQLEKRTAALTQERSQAQEQWQQRLQALDADSPRPAAPTVAAVQSALADWRLRLAQDEQQAGAARAWAATLHEHRASFPQRLLAKANVIAGTPGALAADEQFGPATGFDLLIFEEADRATETELLQAASRARRWVLVGEPETEQPAAPERGRAASPRRDAGRGSRPGLYARPPAAPAPRLFSRLWQQLHCEPRRLPYAWLLADQRWSCRLRTLTEEQRGHLETESVADCPEIELRILSQPRLPPALAEVIFPAGMPLARAKEYIFKELQELPIQALGHSYFWLEEADRLLLRLSDAPLPATVPVSLEDGVRELVSLPASGPNGHGPRPAPAPTCCLEFERTHGWDRARAEAWVGQYVPVRDLGRTLCLAVAHRPHPDLALFTADVLDLEPYLPRHEQGQSGPAVEFLAVPPLGDSGSRRAPDGPARPENGRRAGPTRPRTFRPGAGLELDPADPRQRERLPAELRNQLPAQGLVNFPEAQAVVRVLEALTPGRGTPPLGQQLVAGVTALVPAQVELLRCLVRQSSVLGTGRLPLQVDEPLAFRQRECQLMLVSLTRSHSHRAVTFGKDIRHLALALTRARTRVLLFGDPGTLVRRCQWDGPVDHLDEAGALREREVLERLLHWLQGQGAQPRVFHLREGKCS